MKSILASLSFATAPFVIGAVAGEPCRLKTDMGKVETDHPVPLKDLGNGVVELGLKKGEAVTLWPIGAKPALTIEPVAGLK